MARSPGRTAQIAIVAVLAVLASVWIWRGLSGPSDPVIGPAAATAPLQHTYTVRGRVVTVPSPERPIDDLQVHHAAIPDFKNAQDEVVVNSRGQRGMAEMVMPFPVAKGVSLEGIEPGDPVELTFVYTWSTVPSYEVTEITELPPDAELNINE